MLGGEPLTDNASIRDYNGGIGCHVASVLEETLLLPKDMVELRGLRKNEVFLQAKQFLGMVCICLLKYIYLLLLSFIIIIIIIIIFTWYNTYSLFSLKGRSEYFQNEGDVPLRLTTTGWRKKKKEYRCVDVNHC